MSEIVAYGQHPVLAQVGDIAVTQSLVYTPNGSTPLKGCLFVATDNHTESRHMPSWAIACTIIFAIFCLLGLLFLMCRETVVQGYVNVTVQNPASGLYHTTQIPAISWQNVAEVRQRVAYMQTLTQWANHYT